jgi:hypothetical protein
MGDYQASYEDSTGEGMILRIEKEKQAQDLPRFRSLGVYLMSCFNYIDLVFLLHLLYVGGAPLL